jgi:hypothetical protein
MAGEGIQTEKLIMRHPYKTWRQSTIQVEVMALDRKKQGGETLGEKESRYERSSYGDWRSAALGELTGRLVK